MRNFLFVIAFYSIGYPLALRADNSPTVAVMKFAVIGGSKYFTFRVFDHPPAVIVNMGLVWNRYDESVKNGFLLDSASSAKFSSPTLAPDCNLKSLKGLLNWVQDSTSVMSFTLNGSGCAEFVKQLALTKLEIEFSDVKHQVGGEVSSKLTLQLEDLP